MFDGVVKQYHYDGALSLIGESEKFSGHLLSQRITPLVCSKLNDLEVALNSMESQWDVQCHGL